MKSQSSWDSQLFFFVCEEGWESLSADVQQKLLSALSDLLVARLIKENSPEMEEQKSEPED